MASIKPSSSSDARKGGVARAKALPPDKRSEIARIAAESRWAATAGIPRETHTGVLTIGGREMPCSVLDNGLRVFSSGGLSRAVGSRKTGANRPPEPGTPQLPPFLAAENLKSQIPNDLMALLISPVKYKLLRGGVAYGYEASILPRICEVILDAKGKLKRSQRYLIDTADVLIRGLAKVGVIALVDEATGFQADRARDELNRILEAYISKELLPWTRRFPDEFFSQAYRIHGWEYREGKHRHPGYLGHFIRDHVYKPLPPGVLEELERKNPTHEPGRRRHKHHQFLTVETGHPHLDRQIIEVTTIMRVSPDKAAFRKLFKRAFPLKGQQDLPFPDDDKVE